MKGFLDFKIKHGSTRHVFLVGNYAIKIPFIKPWRNHLLGRLANMQERAFGKLPMKEWPGLCPIFFGIPGGWLLVMHRAQSLTQEQWDSFDAIKFCDLGDRVLPVECKRDNLGTINGHVVAVDYGN